MKLHDIEVDDLALAAFCREHAIRRLSIFGSAVRDDFAPKSDIDIIIEMSGPDTLGLFQLGVMQQTLTALFGREVHLHTPDMIHPYLRERIRRSAKVAYAA